MLTLVLLKIQQKDQKVWDLQLHKSILIKVHNHFEMRSAHFCAHIKSEFRTCMFKHVFTLRMDFSVKEETFNVQQLNF